MSASVHPENGLHRLAGFPVGSVVDLHKIDQLERYHKIVLTEFNSITSENVFKAIDIHPSQGIFAWQKSDELCNFCEKNHLRFHGHTLIWGEQLPSWIKGYQGDREDWIGVMKNHIQNIVSRYKGRVHGWDVVNEAFNDDGSLVPNVWKKNIGDDYIEIAFRFARESDTEAKLFYNDFSLEYNSVKRQAIIHKILELRERGVTVDGVGMQMHLDIFCKPELRLAEAFSELAAAGLMIHLSELDISINPLGQDIDTSAAFLEIQASLYVHVFSEYLALPDHLKYGITFWGVGDNDSWIRHLLRRNEYPLLFDDNYQPKPALIEIKKFLNTGSGSNK